MLSRLLLLLLLLCAAALPARAQAPGSVERRDIDGDYRRPDLQVALFDPLTLHLPPEQVEAIVQEMRLIARNLSDSSAVNHRLRSCALAVALCLMPDDRSAVVANGQLARGVRPAPLAVNVTVTPEGVAQRLFAGTLPLLNAQELSARELAMLLFDLSRRLDPRLLSQISPLNYGAIPDWHDAPVTSPPLEPPPVFRLLQAEVQVLLPALDNDRLLFLKVRAAAWPTRGQKGLKVSLPAALQQQMQKKGGEALRTEIGQRMASLRSALRLRHDVWPAGWTVEITVSGQDNAALPQLFAGMALTLDALLSGEAMDPECLLTSGTDVAGQLKHVLPVATLLPAAALALTGHLFVLPADAGEELDDWIFLHPDQWPLLYQITLHRAPTLPDAMALLKIKRAGRLAQSMSRFAEIAARLRTAGDPLSELRRTETLAQLRELTMWHPQHLSASALLTVAAGGPATLTPRGSLVHLDGLARSVLSTDRKKFPMHLPRPQFQKSEFGNAGDALQAALKQLHPTTRAYAAEVVTLARMLDRVCGKWKAYLKDNGPPDPPDVRRQRQRVAELRQQLEEVP